MVIQLIGDWFTYEGDSLGYQRYDGTYPSSGGSFTVIWESDTVIDASLCTINYSNYNGSTTNIFPAHLVSEDIGSNRVERTYLAPYKYGPWEIYNGSIRVRAFYGEDMLARLDYSSEYIFMFPDAMGSATVRNGNVFEQVIKGAEVGFVEYRSLLYDRTPGAFLSRIDYYTDTTDISLLTIYDGIELTGAFATSSSGDASVFFKAKNVLSIDFIDGYSYRYGDYRYYKMSPIGIGETRMVKVRVSSNNGFPVTGEKVTGRLVYTTTTEVNKVSYTDYGTYTEVDFELNLNTDPNYTEFLVSYEDDNYLLTDKSTTQSLGTIYPTNLLIFEAASLWSVIPSEIEEETDTSISVTYPTGGNLTFSTPDGVIITIDAETDNGNGTTTATGTIRVNEENTASQVTISISDGVDTITKTITILDKDESMAIPTISINPYADLSFPQEGGTKYITITYGNTTSQFINTPYSTEFGVTIAQQSVTETDTGVQIYYAISVPRTTYKRNIPLIFSCSNAQGTSSTATFTAVQAGETPGTEGAYINLDYTMHVFPASGGTFYVQANFGFPGTSGLSVRVSNTNGVYPITWCHAELMGGGVSDDGTEGEEIWKITMDDGTDMTEPFSARIRFSYTNSYGESASAEFIAIREAGDTDVPESSLSLYRTIMRFDANGVFDMGEAVCKADYRWTNEEDIDEPVVVGDWIAITEGTHQTGSNYIIIPWQISVSHNASNTSRTGSVTFSSIGQDDLEHTMVLTVIQAGVEESDEKPEYVDLLWKDCEVVLDDDDVTFRILDEYYDEFYTGRCQKRPDGDSNWFFINKIVQDYVYMEEIPDLLNGTTNYQEHQNGYRHFRLDTPDTVGAMKGYYFKYDWSYTEDSPFILSESIIPYVVEGQKNLVTYCNLSYSNPQTDTITWITPNGAVNTGFQAQAEEYATKVVTMASNADYYVLGGQRYEVISPCRAKYVLYYLSPKGGWCWFPIMGKVNASDKLTTFTLTKNYDNTKMQFGKTRYTVDISTDYELSTGFLTESQSLRMWEILESNMCYLHDMEKDVIFPVLMKQDTVEKKKYQRGQQKMLSYNFTVETSQGRMRM